MSVIQSSAGVCMIIVAEVFFSIWAFDVPVNYCDMCSCTMLNSFGCKVPNVSSNQLSFECKDHQHIMCRFATDWNPYPCIVSHLDPYSGREKVLNALNFWRNRTAMGQMKGLPSATNMMRLEWDYELQIMAFKTLLKCVHYDSPLSPDKCRDSPRFSVAVIRARGSAKNFKELINEVVSQEEDHLNETLITTSCDQWGRMFKGMFFQKLMWAQSRFAGCAYADDVEQQDTLLACLLGPAGGGSWGYSLAPGQTAYLAGPQRSACPADAFPDPEYEGLCRSNAFRGLTPGACPPMPYKLEKNSLFTYLLFLLLLPFIVYFVLVLRGSTF